jgi:ankyrin repeat protein
MSIPKKKITEKAEQQELLFKHIERLDAETCIRLIENGVDVNSTVTDGKTTPILKLCLVNCTKEQQEARYSIAKALIEAGADLNKKYFRDVYKNITAISLLNRQFTQDIRLFRLFLTKRADINQGLYQVFSRDTATTYQTTILHEAVFLKHCVYVKELMLYLSRDVFTLDSNSETPIDIAINFKCRQCVKTMTSTLTLVDNEKVEDVLRKKFIALLESPSKASKEKIDFMLSVCNLVQIIQKTPIIDTNPKSEFYLMSIAHIAAKVHNLEMTRIILRSARATCVYYANLQEKKTMMTPMHVVLYEIERVSQFEEEGDGSPRRLSEEQVRTILYLCVLVDIYIKYGTDLLIPDAKQNTCAKLMTKLLPFEQKYPGNKVRIEGGNVAVWKYLPIHQQVEFSSVHELVQHEYVPKGEPESPVNKNLEAEFAAVAVAEREEVEGGGKRRAPEAVPAPLPAHVPAPISAPPQLPHPSQTAMVASSSMHSAVIEEAEAEEAQALLNEWHKLTVDILSKFPGMAYPLLTNIQQISAHLFQPLQAGQQAHYQQIVSAPTSPSAPQFYPVIPTSPAASMGSMGSIFTTPIGQAMYATPSKASISSSSSSHYDLMFADPMNTSSLSFYPPSPNAHAPLTLIGTNPIPFPTSTILTPFPQFIQYYNACDAATKKKVLKNELYTRIFAYLEANWSAKCIPIALHQPSIIIDKMRAMIMEQGETYAIQIVSNMNFFTSQFYPLYAAAVSSLPYIGG